MEFIHVHTVLVSFFETTQASGMDRVALKDVSSSLRGAATGFSLATGIGVSTTASGINVTSSAPANGWGKKIEWMNLPAKQSFCSSMTMNGALVKLMVTSLYCTPNFMSKKLSGEVSFLNSI